MKEVRLTKEQTILARIFHVLRESPCNRYYYELQKIEGNNLLLAIEHCFTDDSIDAIPRPSKYE